MLTQQQIMVAAKKLLFELDDGKIESMCGGNDYPYHSVEEWRGFLKTMCVSMDFLASCHGWATVPEPGYHERSHSLISLLSNSGWVHTNRAVILWYLKRVCTVAEEKRREELKYMMTYLTKEQLDQFEKQQQWNAPNNGECPLNIYAQLIYVAPLLLPAEVESLLIKYDLKT